MIKNRIRMKGARSLVSIILVLGLVLADSCNSTTTVINGNWTPSEDYGGASRQGAYQFVIDGKAYIGCGYGGATGIEYSLDSWTFRPADAFWDSVKSIFPGQGRELAVSFALNGKGYVGGGYNRLNAPGSQVFRDFYEYTPETNTWRQIASYPHIVYGAISFVTGEGDNQAAYVGMGFDGSNYRNDFYRYDQPSDTWVQVSSIPHKRRFSMSLVINGKVFVLGGDTNGTVNTDFYEYDPAADKWTSRTQPTTNANYADFATAIKRSNGAAFTLNDLGYVVCGQANGTSQTTLVYQYDPLSDTWTHMTSFEGAARAYCNSFVIDNRAFTGLGASGTQKLSDLWEWFPTAAYDAIN